MRIYYYHGMDDLIEKTRNAGLVGLGGGGFPVYAKLQHKVNTVIANGVECEPLMWSDYHLVSTYPEVLAKGLRLIKTTVGASRAVLAFKKKRRELAEKVRDYVSPDIEIALVDDYYPAGDEYMLIKDVLGIIVPAGRLPVDEGILVNNVATVAAVQQASTGNALTKRFVTMTGAVHQPVTVEVPIGTRFSYLLELAGGAATEGYAIVEGGVMMGRLAGPDDVVKKTTVGIVVLPSFHPAVRELESTVERHLKIARSVCDQCYACSEVCPRLMLGHSIEPHKIMRMVSFMLEQSDEATSFAAYCCLCGLCSLFACPLGISPRRVIADLRRSLVKPAPFTSIKPPDPMINIKRIPTSRLLMRLGIEKYGRIGNHLISDPPPVRNVRLLTLQHTGKPAQPVVKAGDKVRAGEAVAQAAPDALSVPLHASISGRVTSVTEEAVEINANA